MLDLAILGLLMGRDHHGYEIRAQLRDQLGLWSNVSFGAIYPALARLERNGLVEVIDEPSIMDSLSTGSLSGERASLRSRRPAGGLGRKGRKVYRITALGRERFASLLADPAAGDDSKSFSMRMALAKYLSSHARVSLLEQRRNDLVARLREVRANSSNQELDTYARSVMEHAASGVELDIAWIDSLLSGERNQPKNLAAEAN